MQFFIYSPVYDSKLKTIIIESSTTDYTDYSQLFSNMLSSKCLIDSSYFTYQGKIITNETLFSESESPFRIEHSIRLVGGKGGFGSQLKTQGSRMNAVKITNFEACRDESGRRLRTIHMAQAISEYVKGEADREQEKLKALKKKIEKDLVDPVEKKKRKELNDKDFIVDAAAKRKRIDEAVKMSAKEEKVVKMKKKNRWDIDEEETESENEQGSVEGENLEDNEEVDDNQVGSSGVKND